MRNLNTMLIMVLCVNLFALNAQHEISKSTYVLQNIESRDKESLDGLWQVIIDPLENGFYNLWLDPHKGKKAFFKNSKMKNESDLIEYNFDTDYQLMVPGDWNTQMEKLYYYEGTIWYKKTFDFIEKFDEKSFLYFEAVNYEAKVYLNGELLGQHKGGYTPFQFNVSGKLKEKDNHLIVKVDNKRKREAIPTINTDWWNYGGITRSVHLINVPNNHIVDYGINFIKNKKNNIQGWVTLSNKNNNDVIIEIPELNKKFSIVASNGFASFEFRAKPELWSPKNPKLYKLNIKSSTDSISDDIGFRTIETSGYEILLNGKPIFLKGISIHEEAPFKTGRVTSEEECKVLLNWAKDLGCNYVRLAHYPHSETMVRLADKMGLLVWSEIPVYWTVLFENPDTYKSAETQLTEMIARDKNRASIILWGIANETPEGDSRLDFLSRLAKRVKLLDKTRLVTAASNTHNSGNKVKLIEDQLGNYVDVLGINSYCGWYGGSPESCSKWQWRNLYNKPIIISEVGGGALQGLHGDPGERWTEEYQNAVYVNNIEMMRNIDFLAGVSPWILMDFRSHRRHLRRIQKDFNRKGLISEKGLKKKAFFTLKEFYLSENNY